MTPDERKVALSSLSKLCPDPAAIHRCKWFKFQIGHTRSASIEPQNSHTDPPLPSKKDLERLRGIFTDKEILSLSAKTATLVHDDAIRDGFQQGRRQWQKTPTKYCSIHSDVSQEWKVFMQMCFLQP